MEEWEKVYQVLNEYLDDDLDGTDLIPDHVRVRNMLECVSNKNERPRHIANLPDDDAD